MRTPFVRAATATTVLAIAGWSTVQMAGQQAPTGAPPVPACAGAQPAAGAGRGGGRVPPAPVDFNDTAGWKSMFDGRTLAGWDGNPQAWKVEDGAIVGDSTPDRRIGTTYLIWQGGEIADFEWKFEVKTTSEVHSGFAYRSWIDPNLGRAGGAGGRAGGGAPGGAPGGAAPGGAAPAAGNAPAGGAAPAAGAGAGGGQGPAAGAPGGRAGRAPLPPVAIASDPKWNLSGLGMDYDYPTNFNGNVEERGTTRGEVAYRGGIVRTETGKRPQYLAMFSDPATLAAVMNVEDWTKIHIIARGNMFTHIINGTLMTILYDDDPTMAKSKGLLGLQVDGVGKIMFKNLWVKVY